MKRTLIVAAIVAVAAAVIFFLLWPRKTREQRVCEKLVALCGIESVAPATCTEGLVRCKRALGKEALRATEDCLLRADSCAVAAACFADEGLAALAPFVRGLLEQTSGSAKRLAGRLVTELQQRSAHLSGEAKQVVGKLSDTLGQKKKQVASTIGHAGQAVERGERALARKVEQTTEQLTAAQKKLRQQIAAEIAAAEAKVETAHAEARKWVSDAIDRVGQKARRVGDAVARQVRRRLDRLRGASEDAAATPAAKADGGAVQAEDDPVKTIEGKLARAKKLIATERYDEARAVLEQVRWPPAGVAGNEARDRQMAAYYRAKQRALQKIVDGHQQGR